MSEKLTIWVITEGLIGTENQCLGIAEALGGTIITKCIVLRLPWRLFSPFLNLMEGPYMLARGSDKIDPPWPDIVIAGGRKAIGIARFIRRASRGHSFVCVVQNPYIDPSTFDLVAIPYHDNKTGQNIIVTDGAPNRITPEGLNKAKEKWAPLLSSLPAPRIAVLVGGNSRTHTLGPVQMSGLIAHLHKIKNQDQAGLMITVSRRTPPPLRAQLEQAFHGDPHVIFYGGTGENPYHGFLAWADRIICTNDSTSMISDAATTGKPVDIFPLSGTSPRSTRFMDHLQDLGIGVAGRDYRPFNDSARVAQRIKEMLETRE